jgi:hypothetical protein
MVRRYSSAVRPFPASFRSPLFHDLGQLNSLDRADLGKTRATDHEAPHLGTLRGRFSLLRHSEIVAHSGAVGRPPRIGVWQLFRSTENALNAGWRMTASSGPRLAAAQALRHDRGNGNKGCKTMRHSAGRL